jgi:heme-degrading monooxygenase HmoA
MSLTDAPRLERPAPGDDEPVTVVVSRKVKPGFEAAYEAWLDRLIAGASGMRGYLGAKVQRPRPGEAPTYTSVFRFESVETLRAFEESELRRRRRGLESTHWARAVVHAAAGHRGCAAVEASHGARDDRGRVRAGLVARAARGACLGARACACQAARHDRHRGLLDDLRAHAAHHAVAGALDLSNEGSVMSIAFDLERQSTKTGAAGQRGA